MCPPSDVVFSLLAHLTPSLPLFSLSFPPSPLCLLPLLPSLLLPLSSSPSSSLSNPSYLSLVPADLLSAEVVTGETGVEDYLIEAHKQVRRLIEKGLIIVNV